MTSCGLLVLRLITNRRRASSETIYNNNIMYYNEFRVASNCLNTRLERTRVNGQKISISK